jgi:hypothetical protein
MLRTTMPEAPVNEHGYAHAWKHHVRTRSQACDRAIDKVPPSPRVQLPSEREFWFGVPTPD